MSKYRALLQNIANASPKSTRLPSIGAGRHEVILTKYDIRESQMGKGTIISADFFVPNQGPRSWAWFPGGQGFAGAYAQADAKSFLEAIKNSLGADDDLDAIADQLLGEDQPGQGIRLMVEVWQVMNQDGTPRLSKEKREPIFNAKWYPIEQTLDDVAATRDALPELMAAQVAAAPVVPVKSATTTTQAVQSQPAPTQPAPRTGLFGRKQ